MSGVDVEVGAFEQLVAIEHERAAFAHRHGEIAAALADRDAAGGDAVAERLHRNEALVHERAAMTHERTAELYRRRIAWLAEAVPAVPGFGEDRNGN